MDSKENIPNSKMEEELLELINPSSNHILN